MVEIATGDWAAAKAAIRQRQGWRMECGCDSGWTMCAEHGCRAGCGGVRHGDGDYCGGDDGEVCDGG